MLVSLVGLAFAGDSSVVVTTDVNIGRVALASGDFDRDGSLDIALTSGDGATESTLVFWLSSTASTITVALDGTGAVVRLLSVDRDGDGFEELIVGMPTAGDDHGSVHVLGAIAPADDGQRIANIALVSISGNTGSYLGADVASADLDGDGAHELLVAAPGASGAGVFAGTATGSVDANDLVGRFKVAEGAGASTVGVTDGGFVVVGGCSVKDIASTTCADGGELRWWDASLWNQDNTSDGSVGSASVDFMVRQIIPLDDFSFLAVGHSEANALSLTDIADATADQASFDTRNASAAGAVSSDADGDALYLLSQDTVVRLEPPYVDGDAGTLAVDDWAIAAEHLVSSGDWNADGCDDVLASDASDGTVYALHAVCAPVDTGGDSGDSSVDSGDSSVDSGDSDPDSDDSSAETGDSSVDSGTDTEPDSGGPTDSDGPVVCEPEFGWSCAGDDADRGAVGIFLMLAGLGLLRRSRSPSGGGRSLR